MCPTYYGGLTLSLGISTKIATESELFLVRPGNGDIPVYSPIDVNATLQCVVNSSELEWEIDGLNFESSFNRRQLHSRQIIFEGLTSTSGGITTSSVIIFGDIIRNNGTMICCQVFPRSRMDPLSACTVLIVYGMDTVKKYYLKSCTCTCR